MSRKPLITGNWKLHCTIDEAERLTRDILSLSRNDKGVEILIAPPFTALYSVGLILRGSRIGMSAQDLFWEEKGAFTGEIAPHMLKDVGCTHAIIGHSERRNIFNESDALVNKKVLSALNAGLHPIICVGESLHERVRGGALVVVCDQVKLALQGLDAGSVPDVTIAYEPIWAIGTGKTATPEEAQRVHEAIRGYLKEEFGEEVADAIRIIYGGSVKPDNTAGLMLQKDIDGALVGGASLKADDFAKIVSFSL